MRHQAMMGGILEEEGKKARERIFIGVRQEFDGLVEFAKTSHDTLSGFEEEAWRRGQTLLRKLVQAYVDLQAYMEKPAKVIGADGVARKYRRNGETRNIETIFGEVDVRRSRYESGQQVAGLCPLDGELNLPAGKYSHSVAKRVSGWATMGSFDNAIETFEQTCGTTVPKRQTEELVQRSAVDFEEFYRGRSVEEIRKSQKDSTITVLTTDGKGVLVYPQDLRKETRKKMEKEYGEQLYFRKRMAQVAAVYHVEPYKRSAEDVLAGLMDRTTKRTKAARPKPQDKRVWAGIVDDSEQIIGTAFEEALRRDPKQQTDWVVVVDGAEHQIKVITDQARAWSVNVTIVCDIIHAIEYVWKAAKMLYTDKQRQRKWVKAHVDRLLRGKVSQVAAGIRRAKTKRGRKLKKAERKKIDEAADYLLNHKYYMRYDRYLKAGYPIGSGVIEGTVRQLVNDRMDITGAHWRLKSAEAVLKMRALKKSGDFETYWAFHERQELKRNHLAKFANEKLPMVLSALTLAARRRRRQLPALRLVP